jgi:hypothetical protein
MLKQNNLTEELKKVFLEKWPIDHREALLSSIKKAESMECESISRIFQALTAFIAVTGVIAGFGYSSINNVCSPILFILANIGFTICIVLPLILISLKV